VTCLTTSAFPAPLRRRRVGLIVAWLPFLIAADGPSTQQRDAIDCLRYGPGIANHPVGVAPSSTIRIPVDWPLGVDGTITCLTCHYQLPAMNGSSDSRLRGTGSADQGAREFCAKCHAATDGRGAAAMHWLAVRVAHIKRDERGSDGRDGLLDAESRRCLSCHDGVTAPESTNPTGSSPRRFWDVRRNHPVGVSYSGRKRGKSETLLRSSQLLPERIRLPNGRVSCVSCHNLYETGRYRLSVSMGASQLCLTCHDKK
jgi:predicted CXXCH cytochrome family protein